MQLQNKVETRVAILPCWTHAIPLLRTEPSLHELRQCCAFRLCRAFFQLVLLKCRSSLLFYPSNELIPACEPRTKGVCIANHIDMAWIRPLPFLRATPLAIARGATVEHGPISTPRCLSRGSHVTAFRSVHPLPSTQRPSRPSISAILPRSFLSPVSKGGRDGDDRVYVPVSIGTDLPTVPPGSGSHLSRVVKDRWRGVVSATTRGPERTVAKQQRCTHTTACPPHLRSSTGSSSARTKCPRRWWNSTTTSSRGSSTNVSWVRGRGGPQANTMGEET